MNKWTQIIAAVALALSVSACANNGVSRGHMQSSKMAAQVCGEWPQISYDGKLDTPETKAQIRISNAKRGGFCATPTQGTTK